MAKTTKVTNNEETTETTVQPINIEMDINPEFGITYFQLITILYSSGYITDDSAPGFVCLEDTKTLLDKLDIDTEI